jgi:hypothetical protein
MEGALAGLPGAGGDAGEGAAVPALLEGVLLAEGTPASARDAGRAWYGDLVGPLLVPAEATARMQEELAPGDVGLRVELAALRLVDTED